MQLRPQPTPELFRLWCQDRDWTPHPGQLRVLQRPERFVGAVWGVRGGKSILAARIAEAEGSIPGARVWCVGPTYDLADKVFREVWETYRRLGWLLPGSTNSRQAGRIVRPYGGFIERKSADNPDSLVGEALDRVILDEACRCKSSVWERELRPRLSDRRGRAFLITSPNGQDWIFDANSMWEKGLSPDWFWTNSPTWDNTTVFPGGEQDPEIVVARNYYKSLDLLELFEQEYGALFTIIKGRIFRKWDKRKGVVPYAKAVQNIVQWYIGYDWGFDHPAVYILLGRTSGGLWRAVDEDYGTEEAPQQILDRLEPFLERNGLTKQQIEHLYYDPSRPEQGMAFRMDGYRASPAGPYDYGSRILAIAAPLAKPEGLQLSDRCKRLAVELALYRRREGNVSGDIRPVKVQDDGVDATAGVLASVETMERGHVRPARHA